MSRRSKVTADLLFPTAFLGLTLITDEFFIRQIE
jgi:hypothetical protein